MSVAYPPWHAMPFEHTHTYHSYTHTQQDARRRGEAKLKNEFLQRIAYEMAKYVQTE